MLSIMAAAPALAAAITVYILARLFTARGRRLTLKRLAAFAYKPAALEPVEVVSPFKLLHRPARLLISLPLFDAWQRRLAATGYAGRLTKNLDAAGLAPVLPLPEFIGVKTAAALAVALAVVLILPLNILTFAPALGIALAGGFKVPDVILASLVAERAGQLRRELPEAVDLLVIGVEAGLGLERTLRLYSERFDTLLSKEFRRALAAIDVGRSRRWALTDLARRNGSAELSAFTAAVLQAEKLGTPLASVLEVQSRAMRERQRRWVREASAKAPVKMLFPLAGLILPALFGVLIGPVVIKMTTGG